MLDFSPMVCHDEISLIKTSAGHLFGTVEASLLQVLGNQGIFFNLRMCYRKGRKKLKEKMVLLLLLLYHIEASFLKVETSEWRPKIHTTLVVQGFMGADGTQVQTQRY